MRQYGHVSDSIPIAVVGAHLQGQPLNHQLTDRAARLITSTRTASCYRLFALATVPPKPGLMRVDSADALGAPIDVEVWELDAPAFGDFVAHVPAPMCIGQVQLADGREVSGFLCEPIALEGAAEITHFGGWRAYLNAATDRG
jgi:allophanate hydrolase